MTATTMTLKTTTTTTQTSSTRSLEQLVNPKIMFKKVLGAYTI